MKQEMIGWHRGNDICWTVCKAFAPRFKKIAMVAHHH